MPAGLRQGPDHPLDRRAVAVFAEIKVCAFQVAALEEQIVGHPGAVAAQMNGLDPRIAVVPQADAAKALMAYEWPGNVRELENAIKHALTFYHSGDITSELLPQKILEHKAEQNVSSSSTNASLKSFLKQKEREYIEQILNTTGGDKEKAAETLKVNLSTLYRKLSDD